MAAGDEPSITRWSFEVIKSLAYAVPITTPFQSLLSLAEISLSPIALSSVQDFERYYDARLGIRGEPKGDGNDVDDERPLGSGSAGSSPAAFHANGGADLAVFEQFERLVRPCLRMLRCYYYFCDDPMNNSRVRRTNTFSIDFRLQNRKVGLHNGAMEARPL